MENNALDLTLSTLAIAGFTIAFLILSISVLPPVYRESKVQNGLAKLRRQLLIMVSTSMLASFTAVVILLLSVIDSDVRWLLEALILVLSALYVVNAMAKYRVYHEQYTPEHKELSAKIQKEMNKKGGAK